LVTAPPFAASPERSGGMSRVLADQAKNSNNAAGR
jgi:hypothetical protein